MKMGLELSLWSSADISLSHPPIHSSEQDRELQKGIGSLWNDGPDADKKQGYSKVQSLLGSSYSQSQDERSGSWNPAPLEIW